MKTPNQYLLTVKDDKEFGTGLSQIFQEILLLSQQKFVLPYPIVGFDTEDDITFINSNFQSISNAMNLNLILLTAMDRNTKSLISQNIDTVYGGL